MTPMDQKLNANALDFGCTMSLMVPDEFDNADTPVIPAKNRAMSIIVIFCASAHIKMKHMKANSVAI